MSLLNFALLFSEEHNRIFTEFSQMITARVRSDFELNEESLPHLTVVQFELPDSAVADCTQKLLSLESEPVDLELMGLTFLPSKDGNMWIEISVLKSERLSRLQREALALLGDARINSGTDDNYRPHITVAHALEQRRGLDIELDVNVVRRKKVTGRPAVGSCGPQFQFVSVLAGY